MNRSFGGASAWPDPGGETSKGNVDVRALAGRQPPAEGCWLWVSQAEARQDGAFTARVLSSRRPKGFGGDVLVHVSPHGSPEQDGTAAPGGDAGPSADIRVWAVAGESLLLVAAWEQARLDQWPEIARHPAAFAAGALGALEEFGADVQAGGRVDLSTAAGPAEFPYLYEQAAPAGG